MRTGEGCGARSNLSSGLISDSRRVTWNAGQSLTVKLSESASLNQVVSGLWKTEDFEDALYHFAIALVTSVTKRAELKVEFLDDFKNVTPSPAVKKNDTAFIMSFLFKF